VIIFGHLMASKLDEKIIPESQVSNSEQVCERKLGCRFVQLIISFHLKFPDTGVLPVRGFYLENRHYPRLL